MSTQRHTNRSDSICMAPNFSDDHTTTPFPFPRLDRRGHQTPRHAAKRRATYAGELVGWPGPSVSFVLRQALGTGARGDLPACLSAARRHGQKCRARMVASRLILWLGSLFWTVRSRRVPPALVYFCPGLSYGVRCPCGRVIFRGGVCSPARRHGPTDDVPSWLFGFLWQFGAVAVGVVSKCVTL